MNVVKIKNMELTYKITGLGIQFSIESKIKIVKYYNKLESKSGSYKGITPKIAFASQILNSIRDYNITTRKLITTIGKWANDYREGNLKLTNTYAINRQVAYTKNIRIISIKDKVESKIKDNNDLITRLKDEIKLMEELIC